MIRVLVVEDSVTVLHRLITVLGRDPAIEVVGHASSGGEAIVLCQSLRPDVVTMDMGLRGLSGLAAIEQIMAYCPTPILLMSPSTNRKNAFDAFHALSAGAVDVLEEPRAGEQASAWEARLVSRVKLVSRVRVMTHLRARFQDRSCDARPGSAVPARAVPRLIAIGGSTGAPAAFLQILCGLPRDFPVPILAALHVAAGFGEQLAAWLNEQSPLPVSVARDGERLPPPGEGRVLMAPDDRHLLVEREIVRLGDSPPRSFCRPSVDVLFESVAMWHGPSTLACLLTGMGRDGAEGMLAVRKAGGVTVAQDESSCAVYGMPFEAVKLGAAGVVESLDRIAPLLADLVVGPKREVSR